MSAFRTYWDAYGRWRALLLSPYLLCSGVFWAISKPVWFDQIETSGQYKWVTWSFDIIPSMVSFSLGALAIFLAFSNSSFLKFIRQGGDQNSYLISVTAAFFHFILVQFVALALSFLLVGYPVAWLSGIAYWVFVYALACGIAAAAALVDVAEIINALGALDDDISEED